MSKHLLIASILFPAVGLVGASGLARADWASQRSAGLAVCNSSCQQQGATATACAQYCYCTESQVEAFAGKNLGTPSSDLSPLELQQFQKIMLACAPLVSGQPETPQAPSGGAIIGPPPTLRPDPRAWQMAPNTTIIPGIDACGPSGCVIPHR
jgi:hypothetical protein